MTPEQKKEFDHLMGGGSGTYPDPTAVCVYIIEGRHVVKGTTGPDIEHWTPMYHPCYSLDEAARKVKRVRKEARDNYRIARYQRVKTWGWRDA